MIDKELIIQWFSDIAEMCSRLTTGNVSHLGATIKGKAIRAAEYIEKHSLPEKVLWNSEKVISWIENNYGNYESTYADIGGYIYSDFQIGKFIDDLRKSMED